MCCLQSVKDTKFESNSQLFLSLWEFLVCCLQSVKDTKFESNSQLLVMPICLLVCCLQSVKDTKFESNSQLQRAISASTKCCLQSVKDTKFESNSQLGAKLNTLSIRCLQSVKDTKFESNSQHEIRISHFLEFWCHCPIFYSSVFKMSYSTIFPNSTYNINSFSHCSINLIYIMPSRSLGISGNRNFVPMSNRISYWFSESKIP